MIVDVQLGADEVTRVVSVNTSSGICVVSIDNLDNKRAEHKMSMGAGM